jgi:HTH-type transcriptional regulator, transcriptional repressor of NAD biosynthesis genes
MGRDTDILMYCSGGDWNTTYDPPPEPEPPKPAIANPAQKQVVSFGPTERLGSTGMVAGRFLPLHRGHQYLLEFALGSVDELTVLVFTRESDPVSGDLRVKWIRELYPRAKVHAVAATIEVGDPRLGPKLADLARPFGKPAYFFSSELNYRAAALALGSTFVPVDPQRTVIPISGEAIRANVMSNFNYLARNVRPWFVRRIAVVGAESTGKTTLCARLREEFKTLVVPEWTRVLAESGIAGMSSDMIQLIARSQIASEDAIANQLPDANAGVMFADTDLFTIHQWSKRLFEGEPPGWIAEQIALRPYDLYLLCAPDFPFVGSPAWDRPVERRAFHGRLRDALYHQPHVELTGSRDERFTTAADAIIGLFAPAQLLSARGAKLA